MSVPDTIAALATPTGRGGIGVIRVSGAQVPAIAQTLLGKLPRPRYATFSDFCDATGEVLDQGIALYFPAPHSFTGEHSLELQGHGGTVVLDRVLQATLSAGARLARPGEFSERAFLNDKLDLAQAEAIADLIDSASTQAARCAMRSLQGAFSEKITALVEQLIQLRTYIEAGIDFVDEEIDLLADGQVAAQLTALQTDIATVLAQAQQGFLLQEGMTVALVGEPNVGKSSLLNCLAGRETAIVTPVAGTTRDIVREHILLDGMPLHIVDTAGLRETTDIVEQAGIQRTHQALQAADLVLVLLDDRSADDAIAAAGLTERVESPLLVRNKIDLSGHLPGRHSQAVYVSAKTGAGIDALRVELKQRLGLQTQTEGLFSARRRHIVALEQAQGFLIAAVEWATVKQDELLAEELRQAQQALGAITGAFSADDLLGRIFSTFCIGK